MALKGETILTATALVVGAIFMASRLIRRRRAETDELAELRARRANALRGNGVGLQMVPLLRPRVQPQPSLQLQPYLESDRLWLQHADDDDGLSVPCCICLERRVRVLFYPCAHLATCFACTRRLLDLPGAARCPLCRATTLCLIRVYLG